MPRWNLSDYLIVHDNSKARKRQASDPRLHSSKINSLNVYRTLKCTKYFFLSLVCYNHESNHVYMDKSIDTNVANEHSTQSKNTSVWVDLFNVYNCPILFVPFVSYRRKLRFKEVKAAPGCKTGEWEVFDVNSGFWLCYLQAVGSPASYLNSFSFSIFDCKVGKWYSGSPADLSVYYIIVPGLRTIA